MSARNNWVEFLVGCLAGAAMGCTTVLMLTPKTGRQVRESLGKEARRLAVKAYDSYCDPNEWRDLAAIEKAKNVVDNIQSIRAAGL